MSISGPLAASSRRQRSDDFMFCNIACVCAMCVLRLAGLQTFVEHMAFVIKPDRHQPLFRVLDSFCFADFVALRLGTFLACESLRASAPPESAHLNVDRLCQNMAGVRFYKMQPFHKDSLQLDGQLRAGCDGNSDLRIKACLAFCFPGRS